MQSHHSRSRSYSVGAWRRRILAAITSLAVGVAASLTSAVAARADPIVNWPAIEIWAEPSFLSTQGLTATSETPWLQFTAWNDESEEPYPDYGLDLRIEDDSDPAVVLVNESLDIDRDDAFNFVDWEVPASTLEEGELYWVTTRLTTSTESGPWSDPMRLQIGEPVSAPALVSPVGNAVVEPSTYLLADVGSVVGEEVAFRVEANWENLPVEVASGTAVTNGVGVASFDPELHLDQFEQAHLRWQAKVQGQGYSEWSDYQEYRVAWKPGAIHNAGAVQYDEQGNRQNRIDVTWGGNAGYYQPYAMTNLYTIELDPGNVVRTFEECNPLPPTWTCLTSFDGLALDDYEVSIYASNALGDGPVTTIPVEISSYVPDAPENLQMDLELDDVEFTWAPPGNFHGGTLEHYSWALTPWSCADDTPTFGTTTGTSVEFADLQVGCPHFFSVATVTEAGENWTGVEFYPYGLPGAPTDPLLVQAGDGAIDVYWTDAFDNGSAVTDYTVTVSPGNQVVTVEPLEVGWWRQGTRIEGLTVGIDYSFSIVATNAAGEGPPLVTDAVESSAGDIDTDLDGLVDMVEDRLGTDNFLPDTDGDGLSDFEEVDAIAGFSDPLLADTDEDSIDDGLDDIDEDGLSNAAEVDEGTSPVSDDTDNDGLLDSFESNEGIDPNSTDSDADGLEDAFELAHGFVPTAVDSDSDSIADGEEAMTLSLESETVDEDGDLGTATASIAGTAAAAELVSIRQGAAWELPGALTTTAVVSATIPKTLGAGPPPAEVVTLSLPYASWAANQLANLKPVRYNKTTQTWEFVNNDVSVSTATHTITIDSPELGLRYAVVDLTTWRANANQCRSAENGAPPLDVDVRIDATWSVGETDPTGERFDALRTVLSNLRAGDRVTVNVFGFLGITASRGGWGGANAYEPTDWYATADSAFGGNKPIVMTPAAAIQTIDKIEAAGEDALLEDEFHVDSGILPLWTERLFAENTNFSSDTAQCRVRTTVLVTDGEARPLSSLSGYTSHFPSGYVAFRNRTAPVHVLDIGVGSGAAAAWLEDIADDSEGTYSYVPTAGDLVSWIADVLPYGWTPPASSGTDSDSDGIPDNVEIRGVVSVFGQPAGSNTVRFTSNPNDSDTDNDGLGDGEEIGVVVTATMLGLATNIGSLGYVVRSDPRSVDTDSDQLSDLEEFELDYDPFKSDADFDDLNDGEELTWGTSPIDPDTDGDGNSDKFEVDRQDQGFRPTDRDEKLSDWVWLEDVATGYLMGDAHQVDRIGWLIGSLLSGYLVWGDLRDIVVNSISGKWVAVGFTAIGLVPVIGDAVRSVNLIIRFINRTNKAANINAAMRIGAKVPNDVEFLRLVDEIGPGMVAKLTDEGVQSADTMRWLVDTVGFDRLKAMLDLPNPPRQPVVKDNPSVVTRIQDDPSFRVRGKDGEEYFAKTKNSHPYVQTVTNNIPGASKDRYYDLIKGGKYYEVKSGKVTMSNVRSQIANDAKWVADGKEVVWVFVPSKFSGIGPAPNVITALQAAGIRFEIHWPA